MSIKIRMAIFRLANGIVANMVIENHVTDP
jgi:hypothetical protein